MHAGQFLKTLIVFCVLFSAPLGFAKKEKPAKVDVYQEFQAKIDALEKDLEKEKEIPKRYDLFLKTHSELTALRKSHPRQAESKEINMSLFLDTLAPLPAKKDFTPKKCPQYVKDVQGGMKSYTEKTVEPFVNRANKVTQLICK